MWHSSHTQGEGTLTAPVPWVRERLNKIFTAAGTRAKTSILCTSPAHFPLAAGTPQEPVLMMWSFPARPFWAALSLPLLRPLPAPWPDHRRRLSRALPHLSNRGTATRSTVCVHQRPAHYGYVL